MIRFALKTLLVDRGKLLIAFLGVVFSLVLVNVQGGLFLGMISKASLLVDNCAAEIWIGHRGLENADLPLEIPQIWLNRVRSVPGVERAEPYIVSHSQMTLPNGEYEGVWVIGCDPASMLGGPWSFAEGDAQQLLRPDAVTVDELDDWKLAYPKIGDVVELNGNRARIVAQTYGILGFLTTPYVFTTLENGRRYTRMREGYCSFFLVEAESGEDLYALSERIRQRVPELDVYTAEQLSRKSRMYWIARTGLGHSFGGATILGLSVGLVMVAQSLYAFGLDHLDDFAALKAIGAEDRLIYRILVMQGLGIAVCASLVGTLITLAIEQFLSTPLAPIEIPFWLRCAGVGLAIAICLVSSTLPYLRIRRVDPAVVLQGR